MPGYEEDEFEQMSSSDDEKTQKKPSAAAGESPTSMSAFATSLTGGSQALNATAATANFNFEALDSRQVSPTVSNTYSHTPVNVNAGGAATANVSLAPLAKGGSSSSGYVAPIPAMDTAEEAIAKVLEGKIWRKQYDPNTKKYYYYHRLTHQTTWDLAKELGFGPDGSRSNSANQATTSASGAKNTDNNNTAKSEGDGAKKQSITSTAASDNSSSLPPDPLLSRGGPNFRYSGFVGGAGFGGGGGESESSQQSFGVRGEGGGRVSSPSGPFAGGGGGGDGNTRSGTRVGGSAFGFGAGSRTTSGGAFGELEGYVAFGGNSEPPSASTTPTPTPRLTGGKAGVNTNVSDGSSTVGEVGSSSNPLLNSTAPPIRNGREADEEKEEKKTSSPSADVPHASKSSEDSKEVPAAVKNNNNISTKAPSDDASSAFSTFSGAAARIAEEAKAKQTAQLEAEKQKLVAERAQQAEAMAKLSPVPMPMLANTARGRAGAVTLETAGLGGGSGTFASPTNVPTPMPFGTASPSPFGGTLTAAAAGTAAATGGLAPMMPSAGNLGALPLNQPQRGVHGGMQGGLNPASPLAFNSNTFNSISSPMLNLNQQGVGFQTVNHPVPVHPAVVANYPQQQQQYGSAPAATGEKLELLQTAEALERLVKAFVVLKKGDSATLSPQQSPAARLRGGNSYHEASDYETLLRAAHYKRTAEGAASLLLAASGDGGVSDASYRTVIPTRGRYLADTVASGPLTNNSGRVPANYRDTSAATADFVQRQQLKASETDNTDLLENEILDTIVAMMTADEGRSMWLNAGDASRHQASPNANNQRQVQQQKALAKPAITYEPQPVKKEAVVDVVSIDHYRAYTYEGERQNLMGSGGGPRGGPLSNIGITSGGLGGLGVRATTATAAASRFHVDAFDTLTGAFVPGADTPLHPTTSMEPSPLGNLLEENLEKYLLKHVVPVRGRGVLPPSAMLPDGQVMPVLTPHVARMILLDLLRICIDVVVSRFSMNSKSTLPLNGRDPIVIVYEGPLSTSNRNATRTNAYNNNNDNNNNNNNNSGVPSNNVKADDDTQTQFSPARFLTEACKRTVQSLPFELLSVEESSFLSGDRGGGAAGSVRQRPRFRLEHWVTKPHVFSIIHALQWTMRKLERRTNDPYADFFDSGLDGGLGADGPPLRNAPNNNSNKSQRDNEVSVADLEGGEWSRVYASEMPFFSLAPSLSLGTRSNRGEMRRAPNSNSEGLADDPPAGDEENDDEDVHNHDYASSAQTERELALVLQGQVPYGRTGAAPSSMKKAQKNRDFEKRMRTKASTLPSSLFANERDYFGLEEDHLEVMAYSASSIGLDVFRAIASKKKETEADADVGGEKGLATKDPPDAAAPTTFSSKDSALKLKKSAPELPLAVKQEIALQCSVACIEELLQDTRILESIKRRATNKANGIIEERNKKWVERWEQGQKALKSGADFVELESKRRREEVAAAEERIGIMVERMKTEINRQL